MNTRIVSEHGKVQFRLKHSILSESLRGNYNTEEGVRGFSSSFILNFYRY